MIEEVDNTSDEPSEDEEVIEETSVPLSQYEKIKDDYLRLAAEFDNYKKRTDKEKESIGAASVAYFVNSLFPLIDNFEMEQRAQQHDYHHPRSAPPRNEGQAADCDQDQRRRIGDATDDDFGLGTGR